MKIVGVGIGPGQLSEEAARIIQEAELIYGSRRAIALAEHHIRSDARVHILRDYTIISELPDDAVVLSTGDPMLSGLGKYRKHQDTVIPGISSMQVACARLGIQEDTLEIITVHGRDHGDAEQRIISSLKRGKTVFLLPDPRSFGAAELLHLLRTQGITATLAVCEKLTYPDEQITIINTHQEACNPETSLYCLVVWKT